MPRLHNLGAHLGRTLHNIVKVVHFKPEQDSIAIWFEMRIGNRSMIMFIDEAMKLQNQTAIGNQLLIGGTTVITPAPQQTLIPSAACLHIGNHDHRLRTHGEHAITFLHPLLSANSMNHDWLLGRIATYRAFDSNESRMVQDLRRFVLRYGNDCFRRDLEVGHVVGSAWIVNANRSHALLTHHTKLNRWLQLGGHVESGDPDVLATSVREATEESGIADLLSLSDQIFDVDVHPIPANAKNPAHLHYDVRFLLQSPGDPVLQISPESLDLRWFALANLLQDNTLSPSLLRMVQKTCSRNSRSSAD